MLQKKEKVRKKQNKRTQHKIRLKAIRKEEPKIVVKFKQTRQACSETGKMLSKIRRKSKRKSG